MNTIMTQTLAALLSGVTSFHCHPPFSFTCTSFALNQSHNRLQSCNYFADRIPAASVYLRNISMRVFRGQIGMKMGRKATSEQLRLLGPGPEEQSERPVLTVIDGAASCPDKGYRGSALRDGGYFLMLRSTRLHFTLAPSSRFLLSQPFQPPSLCPPLLSSLLFYKGEADIVYIWLTDISSHKIISHGISHALTIR